MGAKRVRRTTLLCWFFAGVLLGLLYARAPIIPFYTILMFGPPIVLLRHHKAALVIAVITIGFGLGWWRGSGYIDRLEIYQTLNDESVVLQATVVDDGVYDDRGQLAFDIRDVQLSNGEKLTGKIAVAGRGVSMVYRGDHVEVRGKIRPSRGSRQARISFAQITRTVQVRDPVSKVRRLFVASVYSVLPDPQASFGLGLLVGQRDTLPVTVSDQLSKVGLTHIVAVSGYNLTVIIMAVRRVSGGRSKYQSAMFSLLLIILFLLITGFTASIVRASIVSVLGLWAWYYGRSIPPLLLILCAAAITACWYPFYIWSDVGWYLSFLAFFGVLIVAPILLKRVCPHTSKPSLVLVVAVESFAAQIMTMPVIMYIFGRVSVVSLLANVMVVPLTPYAMLSTLIAGTLGIFSQHLASMVSWPAELMLGYMLAVAAYLGKLSFAETKLTVSLAGMLIIYALIMITTALTARYNKSKYATITDENSRNLE